MAQPAGLADAHPGPHPAALRRVLVSSVALFFAYLLPRLATFGAVVVAARVVGVARFGAYGTAAALAVMLSIVATLGMMQMLVRDLAQNPAAAAELLGAANVAKVGSGVLMLGALGGLAWFLGYSSDVVAAAVLLGVGYAIGAFVENLGAYFQSEERMGVWMQAQAVFGLVTGVLGVALVLATRSIVWFCAAPAVGQAAALAWLLARAPGQVRTAWRAPWPRVQRLLRALLPFAAAFIVLTAYYKVDILLVEAWRGEAHAGLYAAAYKFVDVAQALALVLATAVYPRLSRAARPEPAPGQRDPASPAATRLVDLVVLAGVPAAAVLWLLREPAIGLLFGPGYHASVSVLGFLAPALPALAINMVAMFVLAAAHRMPAVAAAYAGALVVNILLNAVLIPAYGAPGAAAAMLGSEWLLGAAMVLVLHRALDAAPGTRPTVAAVGVALLAALLGLSGFPVVPVVLAYLAAVAGLYALARVLSAQELALVKKAVLP